MAERIIDGVRFRTIPGCEDYLAGEDGRIASLKRGVVRMLSIGKTIHGYLMTSICRDGSRRKHSCHRLVLEAFVGPCPEGMEACHLNGVRTDNRVENLRWDTRSNNHQDKRLHGTYQTGERAPSAKLTSAQVAEIKRRLVAGEWSVDIAKDFGVGRTCIDYIGKGRTWIDTAPELNPLLPKSAHPKYDGKSISDHARAAGLRPGVVICRMHLGYSLEEALLPQPRRQRLARSKCQ